MAYIKICGVRDLNTARAAEEAGADLIGLVFVEVRRQVFPDVARDIVASLNAERQDVPGAVGLFVNESADHINKIADEVGLRMVQLSGDESADLIGQIERPVIKAIRLPDDVSIDEARRTIDPVFAAKRPPVAVLIDSHVKGHYGGTGVVGNWELSTRLSEEYPVILAGGLNPDNVASAIETVRPVMVDVSSGVETDGDKDANKIRSFIERTQAVEYQRSPFASAFYDKLKETNLQRAGE